jgi:hypothetical protein
MHCEEKYRLLGVFKASVSVHSAAVNDMTLTSGTRAPQEYDQLWTIADKARVNSDAASKALFQHTQEHGC